MNDDNKSYVVGVDPGNTDETIKTILAVDEFGALKQILPEAKEEEPGEPHGPRRKAPVYYAGESYGTKPGKGSFGRGSNRRGGKSHPMQVRHTRWINYPDVERYPNGAIRGIRDKAARRRIRARLKERYSSVEANIKKARQLRLEMIDRAGDIAYENDLKHAGINRNGMRLLAQTLALHQPLPDVDSRALRTEFRARKRAMAKERGVHVRELERDVVTQLANKVYGVE